MENVMENNEVQEDIDSKVLKILHTEFEKQDDFIEEANDEIVSVTMKTETKKKYNNIPTRTKEEYEQCIDYVYYETMKRDDGTEYKVKVTVFKPEINPLELLRPAYAYSSI